MINTCIAIFCTIVKFHSNRNDQWIEFCTLVTFGADEGWTERHWHMIATLTCCELACCCWLIIPFCKLRPCGAPYDDCIKLLRLGNSFDFSLLLSNCPFICCCCCCCCCAMCGADMNISFWDCCGGGPDINDWYGRNDTIAGSIKLQSDVLPKPKSPKYEKTKNKCQLIDQNGGQSQSASWDCGDTNCFCLLGDSVSRANCSSDHECRSLDSVVVGQSGVASCVMVAIVLPHCRCCSWTVEFC